MKIFTLLAIALSVFDQFIVNALEVQLRIVGGKPVNDGSTFPSYVFSFGSSLCGGTLIHPDIVLSAAHCAGVFLDGALVGGTTIDGNSGSTFIPVDSELLHPNYDKSKNENDIMLVKLGNSSSAPLQALNFDRK